MTVRSIYAPHLGRHVKLGRRRPIGRVPRLHLRHYLNRLTIPSPPPSIDYRQAALPSLRSIYKNDVLADCVVAMLWHMLGLWTGNAGQLVVATDNQIIADYSAISGYVPGNEATDVGCNEVDAFNYYLAKGFATVGQKPLGYLAIDPTNVAEIQTAHWLFETLGFGVELPDPWVTTMPTADGFVWDDGTPDPRNGHAFAGVGYDAVGVEIGTWGLFGTLTYAAIAHLCAPGTGGELYVLLSPDQIAKGMEKAPNGILWNDLLADFDKLSGNVPIPGPIVPPAPAPPVPPPAPVPLPTPVPIPSPPDPRPPPIPVEPPPAPETATMTLTEMQAYVSDALAKNWPPTPPTQAGCR
jgi:hypothetical protein